MSQNNKLDIRSIVIAVVTALGVLGQFGWTKTVAEPQAQQRCTQQHAILTQHFLDQMAIKDRQIEKFSLDGPSH